ncbi:unnamed protein product, partial [Nesidiocoris tenuis]
ALKSCTFVEERTEVSAVQIQVQNWNPSEAAHAHTLRLQTISVPSLPVRLQFPGTNSI